MHQIKTYKNGIRLVVETMKGYESVSFNMFVNVGSMHEDDSNRGISHFIEHMLFKGTKKRTAVEIVTKLDSIGARVNAYTSQTETVFYTKSTKQSLDICVDILSDMFLNSTFEKKELDREKKVVLEELSMYEDNPSASVQQISGAAFYKGTVLQYDVGGTKESVSAITKEDIIKYRTKNYIPSNLILSFAGNITMEEAEVYVEKYFNKYFNTEAKPIFIKTPDKKIIPKTQYVTKFKDNEQSHILITFPGLNLHDKRYFSLVVFNTIWGSGMSCRLFQIIREKLGLVYSIYTSPESTNYGGSLSIMLSTNNKNISVALKAIRKAIETIVEDGVTNEELERAKTNLINNNILQYENTAFVSLFNAKNLSNYNKLKTKEQLLNKIKSVTKKDINDLAEEIYGKDNYVVALVGKDIKTDLLKEFKK